MNNTFESAYTEYQSVPFRPEIDKLSAGYFYRQGAVGAELEFQRKPQRDSAFTPSTGMACLGECGDPRCERAAEKVNGCTPESPCEACRNSDRQEAKACVICHKLSIGEYAGAGTSWCGNGLCGYRIQFGLDCIADHN